MANKLQNEYQPDLASFPGETLLETLETIDMSQAELARRMGRPLKTINEIIQGKASITAETAVQLEQVLQIPASFWLKREQNYRESLARFEEMQRLKSWVEWLKEIPVRELERRGWIPSSLSKPLQVSETLKFFGVASPNAWKTIWESNIVVYRKSEAYTSNFGAITAWLRQGEIEAQRITTATYNANTFRTALHTIRSLTTEQVKSFQGDLIRLCADAGIAVVFVQELPKTGIYGATQWLTPTKALVQLSLRYKTDDHFWFTFFHEAGHILLHGKRQVFLETDQQESKDAEWEADKFAADMLIDPLQWQQFVQSSSYRSKVGINEFAQNVGIAPGIIVGRLQHEKRLPFDYCNDFKRHFEWGTGQR